MAVSVRCVDLGGGRRSPLTLVQLDEKDIDARDLLDYLVERLTRAAGIRLEQQLRALRVPADRRHRLPELEDDRPAEVLDRIGRRVSHDADYRRAPGVLTRSHSGTCCACVSCARTGTYTARPRPHINWSMNAIGSSERIRVVIGDAHGADRAALTHLLALQPDIDVIGMTSDGEEALRLLRELRPNIALLDEDLPSFGGSAVARILKSELPEVQVMVLRN
jgi:hypothetical protein